MAKDIFGKDSVLKDQTVHLQVEENFVEDGLDDILKTYESGKYFVVAHYVHQVRLGRFDDGELSFADGEIPEEKYLQEIRLFNAEREILIRKACVGYLVRVLDDSTTTGKEVSAVDTKGNFFGDRIAAESTAEYACLYEEGRKIKLMVPVTAEAEHYALVTRSYIEYDQETGQAGYGRYRFVSVDVVKGDE